MRFGGILLLFFVFGLSFVSQASPMDVLVWDEYFPPSDLEKLNSIQPEQVGAEFSWKETTPVRRSPHGLQAAYVIASGQPYVRIHRAYGPALPWQDPEICALTTDQELNQELKRQGYSPIPDCRAEAYEAIERMTAFIQKNHIRLVNMSHGTYFDRYVSRNPDLLAAKYPNVDIDLIQKFLYRNFMAIGDVVGQLFAKNPTVLFVAAAGNYADDVDRDLPMKWSEDNPHWYYVPTMYGSLTDKHENLIAVSSTYTGQKLSDGTNYGKTKVAFAKIVGEMKVPDGEGQWTTFGGTSEAAAQTTRIFAEILETAIRPISNLELKELAFKSVDIQESMVDKLMTGGVLNNDRLRGAVDTIRPLPVIEKVGQFKQFHIPDEYNPKNYGCHSLGIDSKGVLWMTMPWSNNFLSFDPKSEKFTVYPLPTPESRPDGVTVDQDDNVWAGVYPKGGYVRLNTKTGEIKEFPHPQEKPLNISHVDSRGRIWATGHRAHTISVLDPKIGNYEDFRVTMDWPLDLRIDENDDIWATALKGYQVPWGPGAILHIPNGQNNIEYIPLPEREERLQAYWLAPVGDRIVVTLLAAGAMVMDKLTHKMNFFARADGEQVYNIIRKMPDEKVVLTNSYEKRKSLDIVDPKNPTVIESYLLPDQSGEPREAVAFDKDQNIWYCETFTNILGQLKSGG